MRLILVVLCLCYLSFAGAEEPEKKLENLCEKAVNQETDFKVTGSHIETVNETNDVFNALVAANNLFTIMIINYL